MQSEKKQIHCWEETRRYYMKIKYGFLLYYPDQEIASRFNKSTDKKSIDMGFSTEKSGTDEKADFSEPAEIDYR